MVATALRTLPALRTPVLRAPHDAV